MWVVPVRVNCVLSRVCLTIPARHEALFGWCWSGTRSRPSETRKKSARLPFFHGLTRLMRSDRRTPLSLFCWRFTHTHQKTHKTIKKIEQLWVNRCVYEGFRVPGLEGFRRLLSFSFGQKNKHTKRTGSLSNVTSGSSFLPALLTTWKTSVLQASRGRVKVCEWHHQSFLLSFLVSLFDRVYWIS